MAEMCTYEINEEHLICSICLDCWKGKNPKILPCQHTYCADCLRKLRVQNNRIKCPNCNQRHFLKNFPKQIFDSHLKLRIDNVSRCVEHGKEDNLFCLNHSQCNICLECIESNHKDCKITFMDIREHQTDIFYREIEESKNENYLEILRRLSESNLTFMIKSGENFREILCDYEKNYKYLDCHNFFLSYIKGIFLSFQGFSKWRIFLPYINLSTGNARKLFNLLSNFYFIDQVHIFGFPSFNNNTWSTVFTSLEKSVYTMRNISLYDASLDNYQVQRLGSFLGKCHRISYLKFINVEMSDLEGIFRDFTANEYLNVLNFQNCNLKEKDFDTIRNLLNCCSTMQELDLSNNSRLGEENIDVFTPLKSSSFTLRKLYLNSCKINNKLCENLANLLKNCSNMTLLDISGNDNINTDIIFNALQNSSSQLKEISLPNSIPNSNVWLIRNVLQEFNCLESFCLNNIDLNALNLITILEGLDNSCQTLKNLKLINCNLFKQNFLDISRIFEKFKNLKVLNLTGSECDSLCEENLLSLLNSVPNSLTEINLSQCNLSARVLIELGNILKKLRNLQIVDFSNNQNLRKTISFVCTGLSFSKYSLRVLNFTNCDLGTNELKFIKRILRNCHYLECIWLIENPELMNDRYAYEKMNKDCLLITSSSYISILFFILYIYIVQLYFGKSVFFYCLFLPIFYFLFRLSEIYFNF